MARDDLTTLGIISINPLKQKKRECPTCKGVGYKHNNYFLISYCKGCDGSGNL